MATTPQEAAMLVLIRDCSETGSTLEVLLVQRPSDDTLSAGADAFPGGRLTPVDAIPPALALSRQFTAAEAAGRTADALAEYEWVANRFEAIMGPEQKLTKSARDDLERARRTLQQR